MRAWKKTVHLRSLQEYQCYFLNARGGFWPLCRLAGTYRAYKDGLREQGWSVKDIRWLIVSHFHLDHAGLAGVLVENGVEFVIFPVQLGAIAEMESLIARKGMPYQAIDREKIRRVEIADSRAWLARIGILGEVLHTNGHGEHSVSLLLDSGEAFVGDLTPESMVAEHDALEQSQLGAAAREGSALGLPRARAGVCLVILNAVKNLIVEIIQDPSLTHR